MQFGALQVLLGVALVYGGVYVLGLESVQVSTFPAVWAGVGVAFTLAVGVADGYLDDGLGVFATLGLFAPTVLAFAVGAVPEVVAATMGVGVGLVLVGGTWLLVNLR